MRLLDEQYTSTPYYGIRRMAARLRAQGHEINHKRVARQLGRAETLAFSTAAASGTAAATLRGLNGWIMETDANGLWKMSSLWIPANSPVSHRDIEKSRNRRRDFSTFPAGATGFSFADVETRKT